MEEIRAESVRELVLILVERMRVMDLSLLELKSHISGKTDIDLVLKLEKELTVLKEGLVFLKDKQEQEETRLKTIKQQKEETAKKNKETMNLIYWVVGIGTTLFFAFKALL